MATLHTVNKSPFERNSLESCVRTAAKGSAVLLLEDGVLGALKGTQKSDAVKKSMSSLSFYVLGPDLAARGIGKDKLIDGISVVDYGGFVDLVAKFDHAQAWL